MADDHHSKKEAARALLFGSGTRFGTRAAAVGTHVEVSCAVIDANSTIRLPLEAADLVTLVVAVAVITVLAA